MIKPRSVTEQKSIPAVPYSKCPAKTYINAEGQTVFGKDVFEHCLIVGKVAERLLSYVIPEALKREVPQSAGLIAACHDIGKVSPYFYQKICRACTSSENVLPEMEGVDLSAESLWGGHAGVGQLTLSEMGVPKYIPDIVGQHHGYSPALAQYRAVDEVFGGKEWNEQRIELVRRLEDELKQKWEPVASLAMARYLAGLTTVSDWIGSGKNFEDPLEPWEQHVDRALEEAGFIPFELISGLSFEDVFGFAPYRTQSTLIEHIEGPGVYVLEAPMGLGKTEAALYCAYSLLDKGTASGIYFALPTQLTSNKIYERFSSFLARILKQGSKHRSLLLHSKSWLADTSMGEDGKPGGSWFNSSKRGLLAPFAVGTLDQALMAAMNVKHGFVRAFGLAGKVLILDEVHTYDAYTGSLLDALIQLSRELHCTVVILSATLNKERRELLLGSSVKSNEYPLITACRNDESILEVSTTSERSIEVGILTTGDEQAAVEEALKRAEEGSQVLWIENSVADAQGKYRQIGARAVECGVECGLLHSRFMVADRESIETKWVDLFGKKGWGTRSLTGRILVGTQVLEQSLDIDADFIVTRFAPSDMLLQRLGRLWRHADTPRARGASCEAWILAPKLEQAVESPTETFGPTAFVYSPYVLCRSLEVWTGLRSVKLPEDVRSLIEKTYSNREEEPLMKKWLTELDEGSKKRKGRKALRRLAAAGLSQQGKTLPERKAQTRYSEVESCEVLLLKKLELLSDDKVTRIVLLNGDELLIPVNKRNASPRELRKLSVALMTQVVTVPVMSASRAQSVDSLEKYGFGGLFYLGKSQAEEAAIRIALVRENGKIGGIDGSTCVEDNSFFYNSCLGYLVEQA